MKITESKLRNIIKETIEEAMGLKKLDFKPIFNQDQCEYLDYDNASQYLDEKAFDKIDPEECAEYNEEEKRWLALDIVRNVTSLVSPLGTELGRDLTGICFGKLITLSGGAKIGNMI